MVNKYDGLKWIDTDQPTTYQQLCKIWTDGFKPPTPENYGRWTFGHNNFLNNNF